MESLLNRYRNITVLLLVVAAQLILLAVQVKNDRDIHFVRVWTVTAVTPFARIVEGLRGGSTGFLRNYVLLHDVNAENRQLREEVGHLKMDNIFLRNQLNQADRAEALKLFQTHNQSKTLAASIIGAGAASGSKVVYVDRGSVEGVQRGMAVVTPDGIVGKVIASYPVASEVLLVTDPDFAAGVISQKNQTRGTLKGQGNGPCKVDYVPIEEKVEVGEWFYTSGDDRIFPRGFPVGVVTAVREAQPYKEILVDPSGLQHGLEDVLIILSGVHEEIPATPPGNQPIYVAPPPPEAVVKSPAAAEGTAAASGGAAGSAAGAGAPTTEADRLRAHYKAVGDAQNHVFGEGLPGSKPPNFNLALPSTGAKTGAAAPTGVSGTKPAVAPPVKSPVAPTGVSGPKPDAAPPVKSPAAPTGGAGTKPDAAPSVKSPVAPTGAAGIKPDAAPSVKSPIAPTGGAGTKSDAAPSVKSPVAPTGGAGH
jgi:rod shape-determining protein MreC